jgi:preprotein translocase subunit SecG
MTNFLLVIHLMLAIAMIGVVLLQRSEGGALGIGGSGGGGMGNFLSGRGTANLLTRTTAVLAACFMATSILLTIMANVERGPESIIEQIESETPEAPAVPTVPVE